MGHKLIKIYLYSIVLLILSFIVSLSSYLNVSVFADNSAVDNFTLSLPVSCTIGSNGSTHAQSVNNNQYYPNLGGNPTTFTVYCNDAGGYVIYAIGSSDNTEGNTNLIGDTSATAGNRNTIPTGVYPLKESEAEDAPTISSWSMKLATSDSSLTIKSGWDNAFHAIPSNWTDVVKKESGTVDSTTGSTVTATYDAYIDGTQAAGTYTGQVKYVMFHPSSATRPVTLAKAFENAGKQKVHATDPLTGETGEYYKMQDMTSSICNAANVFGAASELELVDTRDSKLYWVTKLRTDAIDDTVGQCWMTENLDLDLEATPTNVAALTSENTNLKLYGSMGYTAANGYICSNDSPTCENGIITWTPVRSTLTIDNISGWVANYSSPYSYDRGLSTPNGTMNGHGYTGNYYNWVAANASGSYNGHTDISQVAANSICPKGWRLPNARAYEFSKLLYAYGITKNDTNGSGYAGTATSSYAKMSASPLYFARAGDISSGYISGSSGAGYYWSSAINIDAYAYHLQFTKDNVYPSTYVFKNYGMSIRCLAE